MRLKSLELTGFKSFAKKTTFLFDSPVTAIVGPNGSGKSNCAEAFRWVLGERSMKSLRSGRGEDLIWNGSAQTPRQNRAAVTLIFDNHDRQFNIDFDEVAIGREVHRDGTSVYRINGSTVRHRDVIELLAAVSLGTSDHYIVNQGDADRILLANSQERRTMLEDALGLRLYQWKIEESEKKLSQTEENMKQVESLRRELGPHLRYLQKQVDKITEADKLRRELKALALEYLKREDIYLAARREDLTRAQAEPVARLEKINERLAGLSHRVGDDDETAPIEERRRLADAKINQARGEQEELSRRLGRLEGLIEAKGALLVTANTDAERDFSYQEVKDFQNQLLPELTAAEQESDFGVLKNILNKIRDLVNNFLHHGRADTATADKREELAGLRREQAEVSAALIKIRAAEADARAERAAASRALEAAIAAAQSVDRERLSLKAEANEWQGKLNAALADWRQLELETENFKRELEEVTTLVDQEIRDYARFSLAPADDSEDRVRQEERRRQIERLKIKLEDMGMDHGETMKEYEETRERDQFLEKELADLTASSTSIRQVIKELRDKIDNDFTAGLKKINDKFEEFFILMFGGGTASLGLTQKEPTLTRPDAKEDDEDENGGEEERDEPEGGIEIKVNLPRKKIRSLEMLSGGERALTSIALLFAMSQVNPPPFLILDETDAALDEANSRKYSEMVGNLAAHSQLILITHNRETMSRAGVLYGVTMGADGVSRLLSIKFDEAAAYAK